MKLSVVTTMYYSAPYLHEFYTRVLTSIQKLGVTDYEFVFVNDGSPDNALEVALTLRTEDSRVRVVDLSRNFGHHRAMMIGVDHAHGDLVFLIDCDLEEPPEALEVLYTTYQASDADVVFGVQGARTGSWFNRSTGSLFYILFNLMSDQKIPNDPLTARLMSQRYVRELVRHREQLFNIEGLWAITGFKQIPVTVNKTHFKGTSTYTFARKIAYVVNALTAFSNKPLLYIAYLGLLIVIPSMLYILYLMFQYVFVSGVIEGWTSLIVSVWFLGGLIIFILGIIGIYLSVIFTEVKGRPYAIVRHVYEDSTAKSESAQQYEHSTH
jgi:putative glycosyltransferase